MNLEQRILEWQNGILSLTDSTAEKLTIKKLQEQQNIEPEEYFERLIECKLENYTFSSRDMIRLVNTGELILVLDLPMVYYSSFEDLLMSDDCESEEMSNTKKYVKTNLKHFKAIFNKCDKDFTSTFTAINKLAINSAIKTFQGWRIDICQISERPARETASEYYGLTVTSVIRIAITMKENPK